MYLFLSLFAYAIVRAYRVHVFFLEKKKVTCRSQNGLTCFFVVVVVFFFFFFFLLLLLLQRFCSNCPNAHADLELW